MQSGSTLNVTENDHAAMTRAMIDLSPHAIGAADRDGILTAWNAGAERLLGIARSEVLGRHYHALAAPSDRQLTDLLFAEALRGVTPEPTRLKLTTRHRSTKLVTVHVAPVRKHPDSPVIGVVTLGYDETGAEALRTIVQAELVEICEAHTGKQQLVRDHQHFSDVVAHELRTPATSIHGFLSTIEGRWDQLSEDDRRRFVSIATEQACRLATLIEDTLDATRLQTLAPAPRGAASVLGALKAAATVVPNVEFDFGEQADVTVTVPPLELEKIFVHVAQRLYHHNTRHAKVVVRPSDSYVVVEIAKAGYRPALARDVLPPRLEDISIDREQYKADGFALGGHVLGLALARSLVTHFHGDLWYGLTRGGQISIAAKLPTA